MPRVRLKADTYKNEDFQRDLRVRMAYLGLKQHDLAEHLGLCDAAVSGMIAHPDRIPAERMRKLIAYLRLEPAVVLRFLGYQAKSIQAVEEEYAC